MKKSISIVTAFFDIGKASWNAQNGKENRLARTADTYFDYFNKLAQLENEIIVFTSHEYEKRILELREGRPTKVITLDLFSKFKHTLSKISSIQLSEEYKNKIRPQEAVNPECWSEKYVLVTNLKYYFVHKAIESGLVSNELVAWVDFGYCRKNKTTYGIKNWYHPFDENKIHLFTIRDDFKIEPLDIVVGRALRNEVFIAGSPIVGSQNLWRRFYLITSEIQRRYLKIGIVDDDQGTLLIAATENPELVDLHFLGKMKWFYALRLFHKGSSINYLTRIKLLLGIAK
ncbi:WlaTC/HtrL family glycosyltransferase [Providencia sp. PROV137]|uniref:WlaTC/HtrL family glycosyltransferase n=1 Tax=Providencia sp. PROV137 TaxID=2949847 RepID=UPI002349FF57|nr:WlaTC/HtrL family glycosyltransferase [Providencia sp. PROV137]